MAVNIHLTQDDINNALNDINNAWALIRESGQELDTTTDKLLADAAGEEVVAFHQFGKKLIFAIGDLATAAMDTGKKIGEYVNAMIVNDHEAQKKIRDSFNG